jgi:hypothetical protein
MTMTPNVFSQDVFPGNHLSILGQYLQWFANEELMSVQIRMIRLCGFDSGLYEESKVICSYHNFLANPISVSVFYCMPGHLLRHHQPCSNERDVFYQIP